MTVALEGDRFTGHGQGRTGGGEFPGHLGDSLLRQAGQFGHARQIVVVQATQKLFRA